MSCRAKDPVADVFTRIVALTPEDYKRLRERIIGWEHKSGLAPIPKPRRDRSKPVEALSSGGGVVTK